MSDHNGADSLVRSDALLATDVLAEMDRIMQDRPCAMEYETDARDTWPARWGALRGFLAAKRDIANSMLDMTSRSGTKPTSSEKES